MRSRFRVRTRTSVVPSIRKKRSARNSTTLPEFKRNANHIVSSDQQINSPFPPVPAGLDTTFAANLKKLIDLIRKIYDLIRTIILIKDLIDKTLGG